VTKRFGLKLGPVVGMFAALWLGGSIDAATQYDDAKLDSFVVAARAVHEVIRESAAKISDIKTEQEADSLREQLDADVEAAIEQTGGLSIEEYRAINEAAKSDPTLEDRIIEKFSQQESQ
jgi:hypothetical protein